VNKRVTPLVMRPGFATHLLDANYDIRAVQELLGHEHVETTQIYTHVMKKPGLGRAESAGWLSVEALKPERGITHP
jgi:integrase